VGGLHAALEQVHANATLASPAGRHALRLAVIVPATTLLTRQLPVQRGYWLVVAAATVLRPEFGATFTRGSERALGTVLGAGLAGVITVGLHPTGAVTVVIVGLLAWAGYAVFPASFALGFGFITAVVVFLLNAISPDTLATADARLLDTLIGGALGLIAYALWPTWSRATAQQALADLVEAQRQYLNAVLAAAIAGRPAGEQPLRPLSRRARLARTNAASAVARSLSEPRTRRIDAEQSQAMLGALRRLVQAIHLLRLDVQEARDRPPQPTLGPLAAELDQLLGAVATSIRGAGGLDLGDAAWPDLRASYLAFEHGVRDEPSSSVLLDDLDEIVDAVNGLAVIAGIGWIDEEPRPRRGVPLAAPVRWLGG
jgi:uncharacterized membrane protein YccC